MYAEGWFLLLNLIKNILKIIRKDKETESVFEIKNEIKGICEKIAKTELWFEDEQNEDLIDACLYQREFLNARYRYLLKKIKALYK